MTARPPSLACGPCFDSKRNLLARLATAEQLLALDGDEVLALIESGALIAYNLSVNPLGRVCPGIWFARICAYHKFRRMRVTEPPWYWALITNAEVMADLFPLHAEKLRWTPALRALGLLPTHAHDLIAAGEIETVRGTGDRVNRSPLLTSESVEKFLQRRRM